MTADLISRTSHRRPTSWSGRASQRRREQVRGAAGEDGAPVHDLWESLVEVLRSIDAPSSALLCTADGAPVAAYGLPRTDLPLASRRTGRMFAARIKREDAEEGAVATLEITSGLRHTVIAAVPEGRREHLLCVSAEGVSLPLLQAWTKRAAEDLAEVLTDQGASSSSSAAL